MRIFLRECFNEIRKIPNDLGDSFKLKKNPKFTLNNSIKNCLNTIRLVIYIDLNPIPSYTRIGIIELISDSMVTPAGDPQSHQNNHNSVETRKNGTRSLRTTINYSFTPEPIAPQRTASLYTTTSLSTNRSRPESLQLDVSILNYEPATRVSSFRRETKTAQTLSIVVGGFVACWLPFFIFYLLTPVLPTNEANKRVMGYLTWLGWINSAINPFIYAFYSPDFRIAFWRLTLKHCSKTRRADIAFQHK